MSSITKQNGPCLVLIIPGPSLSISSASFFSVLCTWCPQSPFLLSLPTPPSIYSLAHPISVWAHSNSTCIFFHLPSNHFVVHFLKFPSPVWCRQKRKGKETAQHSNVDRKTGKKKKKRSEDMYPWVCSCIYSLMLLVRKMPHLPRLLDSTKTPESLIPHPVTGRNNSDKSYLDDLTQLGWQLSLWRTTSSRT